MRPDTYLSLGDLNFSRFEVPEHIQFGGDQALAVHELVGGKRIVDAMGRQDKPLEWSGQFIGADANDRARYLNYLRIAGKPLILSWGEYAYSVVVKTALMDYRRAYEIPYSISCMVVEDLTLPVTASPPASVDSAINDDMTTSNSLGGLIGDGPLTAALGTLNTAISAVSSFANAAQSTINSVLGPVLAVQARVTTLIASTGNTIANIATVGGVLPNTPIATTASKLNAQIAGYTQLPLLLNLQASTGRIGANLGAISTSGKSVTSAGGNLFDLASKAYGDPTAWPTIARANKLKDPALVGVQTIIIPPTPDGSGGVYGA
ncbi:LysM peptidoglycan-binding domain-containing protein [Undibacterium arcticum]|uniref:LysM peptidoglycan-binding domain-containing protein n=1 Tax=Undibacterium arcticum TaxID=1762892 RepID=A0ABV7F888_9BURK